MLISKQVELYWSRWSKTGGGSSSYLNKKQTSSWLFESRVLKFGCIGSYKAFYGIIRPQKGPEMQDTRRDEGASLAQTVAEPTSTDTAAVSASLAQVPWLLRRHSRLAFEMFVKGFENSVNRLWVWLRLCYYYKLKTCSSGFVNVLLNMLTASTACL